VSFYTIEAVNVLYVDAVRVLIEALIMRIEALRAFLRPK
jgi:hypothetical protein